VDRKEAQLILSGLRPGGAEANEPFFAEALALAETDTELKAWWQAQQEFDRRMTAKLREVPVPKRLRHEILLGPKVVAMPPQWRYRTLLAAAAMVAILCVAASFWHASNFSPFDRADFASQAVAELDTSGPLLALQTSDEDKVKEWLRAQDAPVGDMPAKVGTLQPIGCQKYVIHGHVVSLICVTMANGGIAHLFTVDKSALNDPPGASGPQYGNMSGWNIATWSDNRMTYMLATQSSMDDLKQLLSAG